MENTKRPLPVELANTSAGRDHVKTTEFAKAFCKKPQTIRKQHALTGECYGIRPIKIGNELLWPVKDIAARLSGDVK